jgi:hypothetical protein
MARQVLEDGVSFIYLCEPNLTPEEEEFRRQVWLYHGAAEYVESLEFHNQSHPDLLRWASPEQLNLILQNRRYRLPL